MTSNTSVVQDLVTKALALPSANVDPSKWSLDVVLQVAVEVAGLVKNVSSGSKQQNFDLLLNVVNELLDRLQAKEVASVPQGSSTEAVVQRWASLKAVVNTTLPVVFSYTSHLSVPPAVSKFFVCCGADLVALEQKLVASLPAVESAVSSGLVVVDEMAVAAGASGVAVVVEKAEAELPKVEAAVEVVATQ